MRRDVAIRVEDLGKRYRIGQQRDRYYSLRDALADAAAAPIRLLRSTLRGEKREPRDNTFWALRDVSFEVNHGEVVGIIGRNGAGKSTLLKLLTRITDPTEGRIEMNGRVASLLEVGTGFHPELTGRENIYMNGAILGMMKREIESKFDEIVAFAEIEKFLDTPVKRYSSGMYVRLAFAVAAHLEPEILLVDEVLAVGDALFQKKCLGKMGEVAKTGKTVLFVSHNMGAITRLCPRAVFLHEGRLIDDGLSHQVVSTYLQSGIGRTALREWPSSHHMPGNEIARLRAVRICTEAGDVSNTLDIRKPIGIEMEYDVLTSGYVLVPNYHVFNEEGVAVFILNDQHEPDWKRKPRPAGRYCSTAWIPGNFLAEGMLIVSVALTTLIPEKVHFQEHDVVAFQVVDSLDGDSARGDHAGPMPGVVRPMVPWTTRFTPALRLKDVIGVTL